MKLAEKIPEFKIVWRKLRKLAVAKMGFLIFWSKIKTLTKNLVKKLKSFQIILKFLAEMEIFGKKSKFWQIIEILGETFKFLTETEIFDRN